jgi:hypothetical protein
MEELQLEILPQPTDETCGPTCLHALYRFFGEDLDLAQLITEIPFLETGGTLAVILGTHALDKGYSASIYTYNLHVFDPIWFHPGVDITEKLNQQLEVKKDPKLYWATQAYLKYLEKGGEIKFEELNGKLMRKYLTNNIPILTGLSATYLYQCARELNNEFDDIRGTSMGHFVVLSGYDRENKKVLVSDPYLPNPYSGTQRYHVTLDRVINAILLGVLTYDANMLVIQKNKKEKEGKNEFTGSK